MACCFSQIRRCMTDLDDVPTESYPVTVYNINEEEIGTASNSTEYITVWNADPDNSAIAELTVGGGMCFLLNLAEPGPVIPPTLHIYGETADLPQMANMVLSVGTVTNNSIQLTWPAVTHATSYAIMRSTSVGGTYVLVGTVSGTSFTNTGLASGTYYYKGIPMATGYVSGASNTVNATTVTTLTAPVLTIPSGQIFSEGFAVNFTAHAAAESTAFEVATDAGFTANVTTGSVSAPQTTFVIRNRPQGTLLYVRAISSATGYTNSPAATTSATTKNYNTTLTFVSDEAATAAGVTATLNAANSTARIRFQSVTDPVSATTGIMDINYHATTDQFGIINYPSDTSLNSYVTHDVEIKTEAGDLYTKQFTNGTVTL